MPRKYAIVIPDGAADEPQASLGGKTPLQAARTPEMDRIARELSEPAAVIVTLALVALVRAAPTYKCP